jgi:hypothetical protein
MPTSTSMSISQFLALQVSGLQVSGVLEDRDQVSEALDRDPDLAVGVAVGDARSYLAPDQPALATA